MGNSGVHTPECDAGVAHSRPAARIACSYFETASGGGINELPRDAHAACRFANAPLQHIPHPKLTPHLLYVDGSPLVRKAGIADDDEQRLETGQCGNDLSLPFRRQNIPASDRR
jgi:hypothetical protein